MLYISFNNMIEWYYVDNSNSSQGPISEKKLTALFFSRKIGMNTAVWNENMKDWNEINNIPALKKILIPHVHHSNPPVPLSLPAKR